MVPITGQVAGQVQVWWEITHIQGELPTSGSPQHSMKPQRQRVCLGKNGQIQAYKRMHANKPCKYTHGFAVDINKKCNIQTLDDWTNLECSFVLLTIKYVETAVVGSEGWQRK